MMANKIQKEEDETIKNIEVGDDYIEIEFLRPSRAGCTYYRYDVNNPGIKQLKEIKKLAKEEKKLQEYIQKEVRKLYSERW